MTFKKAMTLIEVMVTIAIVGILTTSAITVLGNLSRSQRLGERTNANSVLEANLDVLLRMDFNHASQYKITPSGFAIQQGSRLDAKTLQLQHLPARVYFEIKQIGNTRWLVRRQIVEDDKKSKESLELICPGVQDVHFESRKPDETEPKLNKWHSLSDISKVTVEFTNSQRADIRLEYPTGAMN